VVYKAATAATFHNPSHYVPGIVNAANYGPVKIGVHESRFVHDGENAIAFYKAMYVAGRARVSERPGNLTDVVNRRRGCHTSTREVDRR